MADNVFDFVVTDRDGNPFPLAQYRGHVLLIVNTAPKSALTQQLEGLEKLWEEFRDRGLVVLGFPCDQFANQEPEAEAEIGDYCASNYNVSFPILGKVDVNGDNAAPLFTWLKERGSGVISNRIKWNFTKFLVSADGTKVERYAPTTRPSELRGDIGSALYEIVEAQEELAKKQQEAEAARAQAESAQRATAAAIARESIVKKQAEAAKKQAEVTQKQLEAAPQLAGLPEPAAPAAHISAPAPVNRLDAPPTTAKIGTSATTSPAQQPETQEQPSAANRHSAYLAALTDESGYQED